MSRITILAVIAAALFFSTVSSFAADETEDTEYAYGTVSVIDFSANTIILKEQNYDDDTEADVTYYFSPETAFENINSLSEIAAGNDVDISYQVKDDGKRVVKFISVYKPELEGEEE